MKRAILFGCDIETGGPIMGRHPLLAVGFCVYYWSGTDLVLLDTCEVHMAGAVEDYDPDTLEFWKANPEAWAVVQCNTISAAEAAKILIAFLTKWQGYALEGKLPFKTITDNCWFDDTFISWLLCAHGGLPLRYNYHTGYSKLCHMVDVNQRIEAFTSEIGGTLQKFQPSVPHDHTPVSDARGIVEKYVNYIRSVAQYRKKIEDANRAGAQS